MHAAQNSIELPWLPALAQFVHSIAGLPAWLACTILGLVAAYAVLGHALPRFLRTLDNRRVTKTVCKQIISEKGALEALRITRDSRWRLPSLRRGSSPRR
jgi:hypothetical protein